MQRLSIARQISTALATGLLAVGLAGCQGTGGITQVHEKLASISDQQNQILQKIGELEEKIGNMPAAAAAPAAPGKPGDAPQRPQRKRPDPASTYKVPVGDAATKGPDDALVTIIEWSDFQCPFCSRVGPTLKSLQDKYGDKVRIAFKHNPLGFHPRALPAAVAAEAAGKQGKFWEMHDKLFENQKDLTDENFVKWAKEIGLDVAQFKKDLEDPKLKAKASAHQREGAKVGVTGTPAFFINGRFLSGAQPLPNFEKLVDEELQKAEKLVQTGTPKDKVYDKVIEKGKTEV